jgi:hypothetical protein
MYHYPRPLQRSQRNPLKLIEQQDKPLKFSLDKQAPCPMLARVAKRKRLRKVLALHHQPHLLIQNGEEREAALSILLQKSSGTLASDQLLPEEDQKAKLQRQKLQQMAPPDLLPLRTVHHLKIGVQRPLLQEGLEEHTAVVVAIKSLRVTTTKRWTSKRPRSLYSLSYLKNQLPALRRHRKLPQFQQPHHPKTCPPLPVHLLHPQQLHPQLLPRSSAPSSSTQMLPKVLPSRFYTQRSLPSDLFAP